MEIENIKLLNNNCLIKLDKKVHEEITIAGGAKLKVVPFEFNKAHHSVVCGEVVKLPKELVYGQLTKTSMEWKTTIETQPGDIVYFRFVATGKDVCTDIDIDNTHYVLINYRNFIVAKRKITEKEYNLLNDNKVKENDSYYKIISLNGYVLVEPIIVDEPKTDLLIPDTSKGKKSKNMAVVRYYGTPNECYRINEQDHYLESDFDLCNGTKVLLSDNCDIPLEYDLHSSLDGKKTFYRVQRRHILAKLD